MLYWALVFLVVAVLAAALGIGGIAGTSVALAQLPFFVLLALLGLSVLAGVVRRTR